MSVKLVYACMCMNSLEPEGSHGVIKDIYYRVRPYVDRYIVVDGGSTDGTIEFMEDKKDVELYHHKWEDEFPKQRNNYLQYIDNGDWVCVSDPDEIYTQEMIEHLRECIEWCERNGYDMLMPRCECIEWDINKNITYKKLDDYWKNLIFKKYNGTHYAGYLVHETLMRTQNTIDWKPVKSNKLIYQHIKLQNVIWLKGSRNFFMGGGGPNLGEKQPLWRPYRKLWKDIYGVEKWEDVIGIIKKGNLDQRIKDWMIKHRQEGNYDGSSEVRECYKTYFRFYHPEEEPEELKEESIP